MKFLRWYDKDPVLSEFMSLLECLDAETVNLLAQDFIQIIMDSPFLNKDSSIDFLNKNQPPKYGRWYDKNYNLHTCVEILKSLAPDEKEKIIETFKESFFQLVTDVYYEKE